MQKDHRILYLSNLQIRDLTKSGFSIFHYVVSLIHTLRGQGNIPQVMTDVRSLGTMTAGICFPYSVSEKNNRKESNHEST